MFDCKTVESENSEFWLFATTMPEESLAKANNVNFAAPRMESDVIDREKLPEIASVVNIDEYARYLLGVGKFIPYTYA